MWAFRVTGRIFFSNNQHFCCTKTCNVDLRNERQNAYSAYWPLELKDESSPVISSSHINLPKRWRKAEDERMQIRVIRRGIGFFPFFYTNKTPFSTACVFVRQWFMKFYFFSFEAALGTCARCPYIGVVSHQKLVFNHRTFAEMPAIQALLCYIWFRSLPL